MATPAKPAVVPEVETSKRQPFSLMSEQDSYICERIKEQPTDRMALVDEVEDVSGDLHRLSLPPELEVESYDCTRGKTCRAHAWKSRTLEFPGMAPVIQWDYDHHGKYIFRWNSKQKLKLDYAVNVRKWLIVNQAFFPHLPARLFSVNGAVEEGDSLLLFMPAKRALALRRAPGERSLELIHSRMTPQGKDVLMSGDPDDPRVEMPSSSPAEEENVTTPGLQEGRDF